MNWINKFKLLAIKAIKYNSQHCLKINDLCYALHLSFNTALYYSVENSILNKIDSILPSSWAPFSKDEFNNTIAKCNNLSTPSPDKLSWSHLKHILQDIEYLNNIIRITNMCIVLGFLPSHFKISTMVVISKLNKPSYDFPKSFRPIVLLNTIGKLIEKVIGDRLQFHAISNNFIHQSQLESLKFKSITNTGITLSYIIHLGWFKNLSMSTLTFNITQFFSSLNYHLLTFILEKTGFNPSVIKFFSNYLVGRKTNYFWNSFTLPFFNVNVGVGQGSALSSILLALYLLPFLYILEKHL